MNKIIHALFGSRMYGLDTPESDLDYKGIYLPTIDDLILQRVKPSIRHSTGNNHSKNTKDDVDDTWFSLHEFVRNACNGETFALDMLHSNQKHWELDDEYGFIWEQLVENRNKFYTKNMKAYLGYVKRQAAKYGIKGSRLSSIKTVISSLEQYHDEDKLIDHWDDLPVLEYISKEEKDGKLFYHINGKYYENTVTVQYTRLRLKKTYKEYGERAHLAEQNDGVDWKACHHALRAGYQLRGILKNGTFGYPLPETDYLMKVKLGELDFKTQVAPALETLVKEVEQLTDRSTLPEEVDREYWDRWLLAIYHEHLLKKGG